MFMEVIKIQWHEIAILSPITKSWLRLTRMFITSALSFLHCRRFELPSAEKAAFCGYGTCWLT